MIKQLKSSALQKLKEDKNSLKIKVSWLLFFYTDTPLQVEALPAELQIKYCQWRNCLCSETIMKESWEKKDKASKFECLKSVIG